METKEVSGGSHVLTRRRFLGALAALGAGGLLAGCGGGGGSPSPPNSQVLPDLGRFAPNYAGDVTRNRWPVLPVRVHFTNDIVLTPPGGAATRVNDLIRAAFDRWPAATGGIIGYVLTDDPAQANISVTTTTVPDPSGLSETGSTSVTAGGGVLAAATVQVYVWPDITAPELTRGLPATAAHEFGHALGIEGHSPDPSDLMYVSHDPNADVPLSLRDVNTIKTLYSPLF